MRNCTRDEGGPFGFGGRNADPKPPQAAVVKSRGGERCGNAGTTIPAGKIERGERKQTVDEMSKRIFTHGFLPAASPKALVSISRTVRSWALHHRSGRSLQDLADMYNPCIRGWITYYSHFHKWQLRPTLTRIDAYVIRWARRKYKRMVHQTKGARGWFDRLRRANPKLFAHWPLCHGNGRTSGAV